jgi:hypothetical protein
MKITLLACALGGVSLLALNGCTSVAVDPSKVASVKAITVTRLELPEYTYLGRDGEAALKNLGVTATTYGLGLFAGVIGESARIKSEQPYRDAIKLALDTSEPSFASALNAKLEAFLNQRGIAVNWIPAPPKLADNSGYDLANTDAVTDYVIEVFPFATGFSYEKATSNPNVDMRWRLLKRYPSGKLIETNRGTVFYDATLGLGSPSSVRIPVNAEYSFPGHVTELKKHGDKPAIAMRAIAEEVARVTAERALPVAR